MILAERLKKGDMIGVVAPSDPVIGKSIEEIKRAKEIIETFGFKVKFSKHLFSNTNGYSASPQEKAQDINEMFLDKEIKMIWCAKGGENSNTIFEYLDYETIKQNPKIICGYSDITSITNMIAERAGLITYNGTNFKTIATDETDFSLQEIVKRLVEGNTELGKREDYTVLREGVAEGRLIGGNLCLTHGMVCGKYSIDFTGKILFIEELGFETDPALASNFLYYMKQNGVFEKINGLWIGNYEHETGIPLEKIVLEVLQNQYHFPIIKSNNFGHIEQKIVIPIGTKAKITTNEPKKITLLDPCIN